MSYKVDISLPFCYYKHGVLGTRGTLTNLEPEDEEEEDEKWFQK